MDTRVHDRDGVLSEDEQLGVVLVKSGIITIDQLGGALGRARDDLPRAALLQDRRSVSAR